MQLTSYIPLNFIQLLVSKVAMGLNKLAVIDVIDVSLGTCLERDKKPKHSGRVLNV